jgi:hypothetical protein
VIAHMRVEFVVEAGDESALYDRIMDLTYEMRSSKDVSGYVEETVDVD